MNFKQEALLNWFIKDHGGEQGSTRFQGSEIQGSETSEIAEDLTASLLEYIKTTSEGGGGDHTKYRLILMRLRQHTLLSLLRILFLGRIGSTKVVLPPRMEIPLVLPK